MAFSRYLIISAGSCVLLGVVAFLSYHHGYATCYRELNELNRPEIGNLLAPGDDTMIVRDLQRECMDLESQLIATQREVKRLTLLAEQGAE
ncbi:hypothetical protein LOC68_09910 [Blastopirellula sp. JC732]|uniref:Uncharacterized protein n=1 Tax=Blastopirellula sediminis TaxID=2894196 RepID=A0A9X1MKJ2_9BACT|nr:hypothetical protein [Blastopirellula sediminis]MCC9608510.1 hypothetical protein [Blastopirellula sediminis]MCC9628713.1 hypothetical protein [Blastopirellula sediminis]